MLTIPTRGFSRSVQTHNVHLDVLCDWIEGSILFNDEELSPSDIVDVLIEEGRYSNQDFAYEMVMDAWLELQRRQRWIGDNCAYIIDNEWIRCNTLWEESSGQAFCVLLSLATHYDWWSGKFGPDYTEQGELFELLTKEALEVQFGSQWIIHQTGWTRTNTVNLRQVVTEVYTQLGELEGRLALWDDPNAKELGLDLLCYRPFPDNRVGIPVYLMQCASGSDWKSKLKTPDLSIWRNVIQFSTPPNRAFSTPLAFLDDQFTKNCIIIEGPLLDRCRLLCASQYKADWVPQPLQNRLIAWSEPRVDELLARSK